MLVVLHVVNIPVVSEINEIIHTCININMFENVFIVKSSGCHNVS